MLRWLSEEGAKAYVFFRQCTLPSPAIMKLLEAGSHVIGLHLENSRSLTTFQREKDLLEQHIGAEVHAFSKHGSGSGKYGFHHFPAYEPDRYIEWAQKASMRVFLGNLEDPTLEPSKPHQGLTVYPSAFWLEPHWRDTAKFSLEWLLETATRRDVVLLVHPENVIADPNLVSDFKKLIRTLDSRILQ
jgi:hypothetical protein